MNRLNLRLQNCYGIKKLEHLFHFNQAGINNSYAIYAPNGLMKTSFTRTFEKLANSELPCEERFQRPSLCDVKVDDDSITPNHIYVLKSEIDINSESSSITNILVNPDVKSRYDKIIVDLEELKNKVFISLNKQSGIKKTDIEATLKKDFESNSFISCIITALSSDQESFLKEYKYSVLFDQKAVEILKSPDFISKANEFNERYQELFEQTGTIYQKGIFNPIKAENSFTTLDKQGFFASGHKVHLRGESDSIDKKGLDAKLEEIHAKIDEDKTLKRIRTSLAKNAQTQSLIDFIERLPIEEFDAFLENIKPENLDSFRKKLWIFYISNSEEALNFLKKYEEEKPELELIENEASEIAPRWQNAVSLFNDRFVDMPFTLFIENQQQASLGQENAKLRFAFKDGEDTSTCSRGEIKNLSQGEKRALYLLNFIFDVEYRKQENLKTLFIIDDVADSFDYKNKHAIIQYLEDLSLNDNFYQIILTHNFDFFRTLANNFVHRERCLMANRNATALALTKAEGIKNYFIGKWKDNILKNESILCATIPFTRNLLEYTKTTSDPEYLLLTSLLHWKSDTLQITISDYFQIYNLTFNTTHPITDNRKIIDILFYNADNICAKNEHDGLNLEDKVLLSIAIRLKTESFLIDQIRLLINQPDYWCQKANQFGNLAKEFKNLVPSRIENKTIEKVSITVSSNIHLNSFMYEPILDLTIEHLINLYKEVEKLGQN